MGCTPLMIPPMGSPIPYGRDALGGKISYEFSLRRGSERSRPAVIPAQASIHLLRAMPHLHQGDARIGVRGMLCIAPSFRRKACPVLDTGQETRGGGKSAKTCREALFTPIPTFPRQGGRGFANISTMERVGVRVRLRVAARYERGKLDYRPVAHGRRLQTCATNPIAACCTSCCPSASNTAAYKATPRALEHVQGSGNCCFLAHVVI